MTTTHILGDHVPRKSNFDPDLARKVAKYYEEHPEELNKKPEYVLMPEAKTYALGVHALQEACTKENNQNHPKFTLPDGKTVYRPLTFKENGLARLNQFNTLTNSDGSQRELTQRIEFMHNWNHSCCGIAYPAAERNSSRFKLILQSPELIGLPKDFDKGSIFIFVDYDSFNYDLQLDRNRAKYNQELTPTEIDSHEGWLALFEDDCTALHDYRKMIEKTLTLSKSQNQAHQFMAFWLLDNPKKSCLFDLSVSRDDSCANGNVNLFSYSRFLIRKT